MRGYEIYPPDPDASDTDKVAVSFRTLRELLAGVDELLRFAEGMDSSSPGEEPDDLLFLRAASDRLARLTDERRRENAVDPNSRRLGILGA